LARKKGICFQCQRFANQIFTCSQSVKLIHVEAHIECFDSDHATAFMLEHHKLDADAVRCQKLRISVGEECTLADTPNLHVPNPIKWTHHEHHRYGSKAINELIGKALQPFWWGWSLMRMNLI
jgi:hypothetical protein